MFPTNNHTLLILFNSLYHFFPKSVVTKINPVLAKTGLFWKNGTDMMDFSFLHKSGT
jgi:hypothetical protein